jgi:hypothetical protein
MTVPSDPNQAQVRTRPGTVTTSGYLLFVVALLEVVALIVSLASLPTIKSVMEQAYKGTPAENATGFITGIAIGSAVVTVLIFGVGPLILAPLVLKGRQPARIVTWVLCGLLVCCQGAGVAGSGINTSAMSGQNTNGVDSAAVAKQLQDSLPDWIRPTQVTVGALLAVIGLVVVILLALPASNAFFRKQPEQWAPPAPPYPNV